MPRHQNSVARSKVEQVFCFNLRKTHQDFDFFPLPKVSMCPRYFLILSEHCQLVIKEKHPPDCLIYILQIMENWTSLVATRITIPFATENWTDLVTTRITILFATENWPFLVSTRITILVATENWTELSNSLLRRDLLFSFLCLWWFFGELAILVEFSDENYWTFDENYWILSENSVILVEISTRIAGFEERIQ